MKTRVLAAVLLISMSMQIPIAQAQLSLLPGDSNVVSAAADQSAPDIAGGTGVSLVVWTDNRPNPYDSYMWSEYETSRDIYGVRIDSSGNVLDPVPLAIVSARSNQRNPKVVWNGSNWLVVFESMDVGGTGYYEESLEAVRVAPSGQLLDPKPIKLYGLIPSGPSYWSLASDGNHWVVVNQATSTSSDIVAVRISSDGVALDPPTRAIVPATYFMRSNIKLAYGGGVFALTYTDNYDTKLLRFDSNLTPLSAAPQSLLNAMINDMAGNSDGFYIVWNRQEPDWTVRVVGSRVNSAGVRLDGNGVNISGTKQPDGYAINAVTWDGVNWRVT